MKIAALARRVCLATSIGCAALSAHAWNDAGHMLAALVAFERLEPDARRTALALVRAHPRLERDFIARMPSGVRSSAPEQDRWLFAAAATWPDVARHFDHVKPASTRAALVARYNQSRWHYVNLPVFLDDAERARLEPVATNTAATARPGTALADYNLLQALERASSDIRRAEGDPGKGAVALCWLLHLTADLHQPLHTVASYTARAFPTGDRGGNLIAVTDRESLHNVWDGAAGRDRRWGSVTRAFRELPGLEGPVDDRVDFERWASEGRDLADRVVYAPEIRLAVAASVARAGSPVRVVLPAGYTKQMRDLAEHQIVLAGVRAALVLNALLAR